MMVREAQEKDRIGIAGLRVLLWPESSMEEQLNQVDAVLSTRATSGRLPAVLLVSEGANGVLNGFLEAGLRSHADGCDTARPVGFIEGWFVREEARGRGVGRELMRVAEDWCSSRGCLEMASDALIDNEGSQLAHRALGFEVVDRCVHFRKPLQCASAG